MNNEDTNKPAAPAEATTKLSDNDLDTVAGGAGGFAATTGASTGIVSPAPSASGFWAGPNGEYANQGKPHVIGSKTSTLPTDPKKPFGKP